MSKKITYNGYQAEILDENYSCYACHSDKPYQHLALPDVVGRITPSWLKEAKRLALEAGKDLIVVNHRRYICFRLRHIMSNSSGSLMKTTSYTHVGNNVWTKSTRQQSDLS